MVTVPPRIDVIYQSREGFSVGSVVDLAVQRPIRRAEP